MKKKARKSLIHGLMQFLKLIGVEMRGVEQVLTAMRKQREGLVAATVTPRRLSLPNAYSEKAELRLLLFNSVE